MAQPKIADLVWADFDEILATAPEESPWQDGMYQPDHPLLCRLLESPLHRSAPTTSGMPAKAMDVWVAHELRRAGFPPDEVWPRPTRPRVLPREVGLLRGAPPSGRSPKTCS